VAAPAASSIARARSSSSVCSSPAREAAGRGRERRAAARVARRVHQRLGHGRVRHRGGCGEVPRALGAAGAEGVGERPVRLAALGRAAAVVDRRADERVVEVDLAAAQRDQPGGLGGLERVRRQPGVRERAGDHVRPHGLGAGGDEQGAARRLGQRVDAAAERALERVAGP